MRILALGIVLAAATIVGVLTTSCQKTCDELADCSLDEICDRDGVCIAAPARPDIPVGEGEGEGEEGEGEEGEGEGEGEGLGGGCPGSVDDTFDPDRVYLVGTLCEGGCGCIAIAPLDAPENGAWGLHCFASNDYIRPNDGRYVYSRSDIEGVLVFNANNVSDGEDDDEEVQCELDLPNDPDPVEDDTFVAIAGCSATNIEQFSVRMRPDTGDLIYRCEQEPTGTYVDEDNEIVFVPADQFGESLLHVGANDLLLIEKSFGELDLIDAGGVRTPVTGVEDVGDLVTVRAFADGFRAVTVDTFSEPVVAMLWVIPTDGVAFLVGEYPAAPEQFSPQYFGSELDSQGRLFTLGGDNNETFVDVGLRFTIGDAEGELIYTELDDPFVKQHGSQLVTGP